MSLTKLKLGPKLIAAGLLVNVLFEFSLFELKWQMGDEVRRLESINEYLLIALESVDSGDDPFPVVDEPIADIFCDSDVGIELDVL